MLDINFNSNSDHCLPHLKLQHVVAATGYPHPLLPEAQRAAHPTELQLASGPRLAFDRVFPQTETTRKRFRNIALPLRGREHVRLRLRQPGEDKTSMIGPEPILHRVTAGLFQRIT